MKRSKYEIDTLAEIIFDQIMKARDEKMNSNKKAIYQYGVKKGYFKKKAAIHELGSEIITLQNKRTKLLDSLEKDLGIRNANSDNIFLTSIGRKFLNYKTITVEAIAKEVLLSSDEGADILVKNIVKQFT